MSTPQLQNLGLSSVAWAGADVGSFFDDCDGGLLARFYEFGVFQPFCRNHSAKGTRPQEPWAFGERYEAIVRKMLKLRMCLLPYLYGLFEECHRTGAPILRPSFSSTPTTSSSSGVFSSSPSSPAPASSTATSTSRAGRDPTCGPANVRSAPPMSSPTRPWESRLST